MFDVYILKLFSRRVALVTIRLVFPSFPPIVSVISGDQLSQILMKRKCLHVASQNEDAQHSLLTISR